MLSAPRLSELVTTSLLLSIASCADDSSGAGTSISQSLGCADGTLDASVERVEFEYDGETRPYELHVPSSYDGSSPFPLVLSFHGFTSNAQEQRLLSQMDETADANDFIVAYPNGIDASWNGGDCCGQAAIDGVDDVAFTRALLDDLGARGCIDPSRVYATGMSNGGFMSHRLACDASDIIAAIGPVAGVLGLEPADCDPERAVPVIHFHGTEDTVVPFDGGGFAGSASVADTADAWADINGCTDEPTVTFDEGMVTCETVSECNDGASVTFCTITGGGHCWPSSPCPDVLGLDLGEGTTDINANDAMWDLFSSVRLPE